MRERHVDLLDDVERLVRARILPAQISEVHIGTDPGVSPRDVGGWGSHGPAHAGVRCLPEVVAAVAHTLCDICGHACTYTDGCASVNLHCDHEDAALKVVCDRGERAQVTVQVTQPVDLAIRVPGWTGRDYVHLMIDATPQDVLVQGSFARVRAASL